MASVGQRSHAIGPGDLLEVSILSGMASEEPEPHQGRVREDGHLEVPYVGAVAVAGLEPVEAGQQIASVAVDRGVFVSPQVTVTVAEQATNRVTVLGAVEEPGVQEVPRSACDLLGAIAAAGGFTADAGTVVEVLRYDSPHFASHDGGEPESGVRQVGYEASLAGGAPTGSLARTERIDLAAADRGGIAAQQISDRDVLVVRPKEKRVVHVAGLVREPDQFELTEDHDLRLLDAVAMAGGVKSPVADKVLVIRQSAAMDQPAVIEASLAEAKRGGPGNLLLRSGDLITVEPTVATTVVETFSTLFRITMGVGSNLTLF